MTIIYPFKLDCKMCKAEQWFDHKEIEKYK